MDDCIFCKIMRNEIPSYTVYEYNEVKAFLDIGPGNLGHLLVVPKTHFKTILDMDDATASTVMIAVKKIAIAMNEALKPDGINIVQNNGAAAGQTVNHFHLHIIPRYEKDQVHIGWEMLDPEKEALLEVSEKIKYNLLEETN